MMKEMIKFSSLPEEKLVINSKTGQISNDPKNRQSSTVKPITSQEMMGEA
jgi:hypothetical protein